ncbi:unnamed protein product [Ostreobium quekettii]|uniref:Uncharacterized protein n=1 Tax=Ostreobium quekettii TaxID=121088 RepID=A0A8S1IVM0_9CHLO|nr:unnamed protein product [Ostreobium quekettii]|eukprot:evm.model.scf_102.7 EVM.evm.TU.scf_102.7   scf_102:121521-123732(+)
MALGRLCRSLGGLCSAYGAPAAADLCRAPASAWRCLPSSPLSVLADPAPHAEGEATSRATSEPSSSAAVSDQGDIEQLPDQDAVPNAQPASTFTPSDHAARSVDGAGSSSGPPTSGGDPVGGSAAEKQAFAFPNDASDRDAAFVLVKKDAVVGKISAAILNRLRAGKRVVMYSTGDASVSNAVKSMALARLWLGKAPVGDDSAQAAAVDFGCRVVHQPGAADDRISKFMFALQKVEYRVDSADIPPEQIFRPEKNTDGRSYGSLIASNLELGRSVAINAMGPRPVAAMVLAHTWARKMLRSAGHDCLCFPEFHTVKVPEWGDRTVVQMMFKKVPFDVEQDFKPEWRPRWADPSAGSHSELSTEADR